MYDNQIEPEICNKCVSEKVRCTFYSIRCDALFYHQSNVTVIPESVVGGTGVVR